jgi:hypothetical protein
LLHQLRSTIAQVGGKKELIGRTDIEISSQCARLIANAKALILLTQISPAVWRHILLNGYYTSHSDGKMIDLDALVAEMIWE